VKLRSRRWDRAALRAVAVVAMSMIAATAGVAAAEAVGVENASSLYLVAVVGCAVLSGTWAAVTAAVVSFLAYDFLFIEPVYTFTVSDPGEWLNLFLLLFAGVVVGQLAAMQRARAEAAVARELEAQALVGVSRVLATRASTDAALGQIARVLQGEAGMRRVWIGFGGDAASERVAAVSDESQPRPGVARVRVLQRRPGDEPAVWALVQQPESVRRRQGGGNVYRVRIEASGEALGSIWAERDPGLGQPDRPSTRLLAAAADQIGQAMARDRVADEARAAEVARQGDALKTSLLQSVSHDFRTPLAVIRAAAGTLDGDGVPADDRHANVVAIEREVEYLNSLVANLLDMSRIEGGALRAERDLYDLDDAVRQTVDRRRSRFGGRRLELEVEPAIVRVDGVFLDAAMANLVENALKYTPSDAVIRISSAPVDERTIRLTVEDSGPGVIDDALPHLFEKFYRAPGAPRGSRSGLGIGLAVVKGLVEATGGHVRARRSVLGGLAIDLDLPLATPRPEPDASDPADGSGAEPALGGRP
jgi:two-component system, OmpR family, sensor histidine kinase KdpD